MDSRYAITQTHCRTSAEYGNLSSTLSLNHLAELQADAVAKGALNMDRQVEAAAARGALHLEQSQPLSNLEISALAQKVIRYICICHIVFGGSIKPFLCVVGISLREWYTLWKQTQLYFL